MGLLFSAIIPSADSTAIYDHLIQVVNHDYDQNLPLVFRAMIEQHRENEILWAILTTNAQTQTPSLTVFTDILTLLTTHLKNAVATTNLLPILHVLHIPYFTAFLSALYTRLAETSPSCQVQYLDIAGILTFFPRLPGLLDLPAKKRALDNLNSILQALASHIHDIQAPAIIWHWLITRYTSQLSPTQLDVLSDSQSTLLQLPWGHLVGNTEDVLTDLLALAKSHKGNTATISLLNCIFSGYVRNLQPTSVSDRTLFQILELVPLFLVALPPPYSHFFVEALDALPPFPWHRLPPMADTIHATLLPYALEFNKIWKTTPVDRTLVWTPKATNVEIASVATAKEMSLYLFFQHITTTLGWNALRNHRDQNLIVNSETSAFRFLPPLSFASLEVIVALLATAAPEQIISILHYLLAMLQYVYETTKNHPQLKITLFSFVGVRKSSLKCQNSPL